MPSKGRGVAADVQRIVDARRKRLAVGEGSSAQGSKKSKTSSPDFNPFRPPILPPLIPVTFCLASSDVVGPSPRSSVSALPHAASAPMSSSAPISSSLAQTTIDAIGLVSHWKEHLALQSQISELEDRLTDRDRELHFVREELKRSRENQTRARESSMKTSQELSATREELTYTRRVLYTVKRELTSLRSSFDETVTTRANEQAADQIFSIIEALNRRFPGVDFSWIYGEVDGFGDDDTSDIPPSGAEDPIETAEDPIEAINCS